MRKNKYTCDDDFFSRDTPESFYWAGFIAADGCVHLKRNSTKMLSIGLAEKDIEHLQEFKDAINFTGIIRRYRIKGEYFGANICIYSSRLFDDLAKFNVIQRKTLIYEMPNWIIGHPLANHFMRGYFDGDGTVHFVKNRQKKY